MQGVLRSAYNDVPYTHVEQFDSKGGLLDRLKLVYGEDRVGDIDLNIDPHHDN